MAGTLLRNDWLGPKLQEEISDGLDWRRVKAEDKANIRNSQTLEQMYTDDSSNLRFKCNPDEGSAVQIIHVDPQDEDRGYVDVTVSDSYTSIKARFAIAYVDKFRNKYRRSITSQMKGAIFTLEAIEIVVDHAGASEADIVHLLILEANFQSAGGPPIFGKPTPIHKRPKIQGLIAQLRDSVEDDLASQCGESQSRRSSLGDNHLVETQFATQVTASKLKPKKRLDPISPGPQNASQLGRATVTAGVDAVALLSHLGGNGSSRQPSKRMNSPNQSETSLQSPAIAMIKKEPIDRDQASHSKVVDKNVDLDSQRDVVAGEPHADLAVSTIEVLYDVQRAGRKESTLVTNGATVEADDAPTSFQAPPPTVHSSVQPTSSAAASIALNGLDRMIDSQIQNPSLPSSTSVAVQSSGSNARSTASKTAPQKFVSSSGPWKGTVPISRAVGRVSQEQDEILERIESWLPQAAGKASFPLGNVPAPVFALLSKRAEKSIKAPQSQGPSGYGPDEVDHGISRTKLAEEANGDEHNAENENMSTSEPSSSAVSWDQSEYAVERMADYRQPPDSSGQQNSPAQPAKRMGVVELPPDSSAPQSPSRQAYQEANFAKPETYGAKQRSKSPPGFAQRQMEESYNQESTSLRSSPPEPRHSSPVAEYRPEDGDEDDMEMSAPKPLPASKGQLRQNTPKLRRTGAATPLRKENVSHVEETPHVRQERLVGAPNSSSGNFMARHMTSPFPAQTTLSQQVSVGQGEFRFDGVADSLPSSDHEDLIETQIQNEIASHASLQKKKGTKQPDDERRRPQSYEKLPDAQMPEDHDPQRREIAQNQRTLAPPSTPSAKSRVADAQSHGDFLPPERWSKRTQPSPSPERSSSKRPKSFHYGFSQESPVSQDPKVLLQEQRKEHKKNYRQRRDAGAEDANKSPGSPSTQPENAGPTGAMGVQTAGTNLVPRLPQDSLDSHSLSHTESYTLFVVPEQESGHKIPQGSSLNQASASSLSNVQAKSTASPDPDMSRSTNDVFAQFQAAYPEYDGDRSNFIRLCRIIEEQRSQSSWLFPPMLWDEFVARHRTEYTQYYWKCWDDIAVPKSYTEYFTDLVQDIDKPKFDKLILNKSSLNTVFELANQPERVSQQQRVRSRSPTDEKRRSSNDPRGPSGAYRERSPFSNRSGNRGPHYRDGDSYRPSPRRPDGAVTQRSGSYAPPLQALHEKRKQQHQKLILLDSPSKHSGENLSAHGLESSPSSHQRAAAMSPLSSSLAQQPQPSISGPRAPGPSQPSVVLDQTNANFGPFTNGGSCRDNGPALADAKAETPSNSARRDGRGRGRGGHGGHRELAPSDCLPTSNLGQGRGKETTPTIVKTEKPVPIDLTKSSPAVSPSKHTGGHNGGSKGGRGRGGYMYNGSPRESGISGRGTPVDKFNTKSLPAVNGGLSRTNDTALMKTEKPITAPTAVIPKKPEGRSGPGVGEEEQERGGFAFSHGGAASGRGGGSSSYRGANPRHGCVGGGGSNHGIRAPAPVTTATSSRTAPSPITPNNTTPSRYPSAPAPTPAFAPSLSASTMSRPRADTAASAASSDGSTKKPAKKKKKMNVFTNFKKGLDLGGGGASGSPGSMM